VRVYFLDVGQGTCNVIPTGKGRAIVIDTGRDVSVLKRLLTRLKVHTISVLVISHCDQDHWGVAPALLSDTTLTIEKICFHFDHKTKQTAFWTKVKEKIQKDEIDPSKQLVELKCDDKPRLLWKSDDDTTEIKILAPTFGQSVESHVVEDANAASGVLLLRTDEKSIVFPGDSHYSQWEAIRTQRKKVLECDVLAVPHHAGIIWDRKWNDGEIANGLDKLYQDFVKPKFAVVSVGTSNTYDHPMEAVVRALRRAGATVLCTQMTARCNPNLEVRRASPVRPLLSDLPGASLPILDQTDSKDSRNVACAGTVVVDIGPKRLAIHRLQDHQSGVDQLLRPLPLCRQ
jgi:competence protein ComEC